MADRKESTADIKVTVGDGEEIVVERLTVTKEIDVETIYGSGRVMPDAYAINQISYQGTIELNGNRLDLENQLFDSNGIPVEVSITITHFDGTSTSFTGVIVTSDGYEASQGESTSTTFEFAAHGRESTSGVTDTEPTTSGVTDDESA